MITKPPTARVALGYDETEKRAKFRILKMFTLKGLNRNTYDRGVDRVISEFDEYWDVWKSLSHPCFVRIVDTCRDKDYYYNVYEYCKGSHIGNFVKKNDRDLTNPEIVNILAHLLIALDECHARDEIVKNLMTDHVYLVDSKDASTCRVKIGSFPNSKYKEEEERITKNTSNSSNYHYKPHEILEGPW